MKYKYTPEQCLLQVKKYHVQTETQQMVFPDLAGLLNFLDIDDEEYEALTKDPSYEGVWRYARRRRESYLNRAAINSKNTTGIKILLQQPENGGYVEKPVDKTPRTFTVVLRGMEDEDDTDSDDSTDNSVGNSDNDTDDVISGDAKESGQAAGHDSKPRRKSSKAK